MYEKDRKDSSQQALTDSRVPRGNTVLITADTNLDFINSNQQWDWEKIRDRYVRGWPVSNKENEYLSLRSLAKRIGINPEIVKERCAKEKWTDLRSTFQQANQRAVIEKRREASAKRVLDFDEKQYNMSLVGTGLVVRRLEEIQNDVEQLRAIREAALEAKASGQPYDETALRSAIYHRELEALAKAGAAFQEIGMRALGIDKQRMEITNIEATQNNISITAELKKDDTDRLAAFIQVANDTGVIQRIQKLADERSAQTKDGPLEITDGSDDYTDEVQYDDVSVIPEPEEILIGEIVDDESY